MNLNDMSKPMTAKTLNELSLKRFGKKLKLEDFDLHQLYDARNKVRTVLFNVETNESYESVNSGDTYHKNKMFLDIINAEINEREKSLTESKRRQLKNSRLKNKNTKKIVETAEEEAELIMAAKDMVDKITGWMEHTSEMQSETMLSLGDAIRIEKGSKESKEFINIVKPSLDAMYESMESTRHKLISGVELLTGVRSLDMGDEPELEDDFDDSDDFAASSASKGGNSLEGREKRESFNRKGNLLNSKKKV